MIDVDGYRPNVGIIIFNDDGQLLWAKRVGQEAWQFPQGGIQKDETAEQAAMRELHEEVGLEPDDVEVISSTQEWLHYRLPEQYIRQHSNPVCIGQKQRWFLLRLKGNTDKICFDQGDKAEFESWQWVSYWYPLNQVIAFKREVYRQALLELLQPMSGALPHSLAT